MREILFRGKRVDNGEWVTGDMVSINGETFIYCVPVISTSESGKTGRFGVSGYEVDPSTVGEYTGMTDRNSKKVFEGDILDFDYDTSPVRMSDYCWCLDDGVTLICELNNVEAIGNIHDNADLLK